ncbi:hypothetical protein CCACVL1_04057 [Corchorus capsularis]|uniref:Uncharacterized protein n=1 Tax=Corchorus capsularis TaxID=210143 RepID=A0A1R3JVJ6_COCAP|nr:hypothetical protein CCACVL1_04057 [Corchorus capsularis]
MGPWESQFSNMDRGPNASAGKTAPPPSS